jgi:hypothetical protein
MWNRSRERTARISDRKVKEGATHMTKTYAINQLCYEPIAVTVTPREGLLNTELRTPTHTVSLLLTACQLGQVYLQLRRQVIELGLIVPRRSNPSRAPAAGDKPSLPPVAHKPDDDDLLLLFDGESG